MVGWFLAEGVRPGHFRKIETPTLGNWGQLCVRPQALADVVVKPAENVLALIHRTQLAGPDFFQCVHMATKHGEAAQTRKRAQRTPGG
jgi:hypothetical protein